MSHRISIVLPAIHEYLEFITESFEHLIKHKITGISDSLRVKFAGENKLLMHELYTNAINHAGSKVVEFIFDVKDDYVDIQMITDGPGFTIKPVNSDSTPGTTLHRPPFANHLIQNEFIVHLDPDYEVVCKVLDSTKLEFYDRERGDKTESEMDLLIPEHFGLFIITNLGKNVKFEKDGEGRNIFQLKRKFPLAL